MKQPEAMLLARSIEETPGICEKTKKQRIHSDFDSAAPKPTTKNKYPGPESATGPALSRSRHDDVTFAESLTILHIRRSPLYLCRKGHG